MRTIARFTIRIDANAKIQGSPNMNEEKVETGTETREMPKRQRSHGKGGNAEKQPPVINPDVTPMHLGELKHSKIVDLHELAREAGVDVNGSLRKQDIVFEMLRWQAERPCIAQSHNAKSSRAASAYPSS